MVDVPNTFAPQAGSVPAAELDENFTALAAVATDAKTAAEAAQTAAETVQSELEGYIPEATALIDAKLAVVDGKIVETEAATDAANAAAESVDVAVTGGLAQIATAGATQVAAVNDAGAAKVTAINDAGTTQVDAVNAAGATQVAAVNSAGTTQTAAVNSAGTTQTTAVNAAGTTQVSAVNTAGSTQTAAVNSAGATQTAAVEAAGVAAVEDVTTAGTTQVTAVNDAGAAWALALGMPESGVIDVIPASAGFLEGSAYTDMNGWTAPAYYSSPTGVVGQVVRIKIPGADFSGLAGAVRIWVPPPPLPFDYNIVFLSGQSNISGQDALPMPARTPTDFAAMLGTVKPNDGTTPGTTFTQALGSEYIFGGTNHQGTTLPLAAADKLEKLIEDINGQTFSYHGQKVLFVQIGLSSADVPNFSHGTAHFTSIENWCTAAAAAAALEGKTIGAIAGAWGWGAFAYASNYSQALCKSRIDNYWKNGGDVSTYLLPKFGQSGTIPVGIFGSHHHYQAANVFDLNVARAEQELIAEYPDIYHMIDGEGIHFLNGANLGFGGSTTHHHPNEEEMMGGKLAWFIHTVVVQGETWNDMIPTAAKTGARQITVTIADFPENAYFGFKASGLTPTIAQPMHGWAVSDQASPGTLVTLVRPPYPGAVAGTLILDTTADIPASWEVRFGARATSNTLAGNTVIYFTDAPTVPIKGVETPLFRSMPAFKLQGS